MKSSRQWTASAKLRGERVVNAFSISGAPIPAGEYRWVEGRLAHTQPGGALLRGTVPVEGGPFCDGTRLGFSVSPTWNGSRHLELNGLFSASRLSFDERDGSREQIRVQVARLRAPGLPEQGPIHRLLRTVHERGGPFFSGTPTRCRSGGAAATRSNGLPVARARRSGAL